ncbi:hypothetical protein, partial [Falsiroseomonas oryzae]
WRSATDTAYRAGDRAYRAGAEYGRSAAGLVEQQPLLLGAVGLALGAALGALLPPSEAEDRLMGESRDRMANRLSGLASEAYQDARAKAEQHLGQAQEHLGEAYGRTRERVAGAGLSPTEGVSALGEVARDLRHAVERTAQDMAGAAREATKPANGGEASNRDTPREGGTPPTGGSSTGIPPTRTGPESGGPV